MPLINHTTFRELLLAEGLTHSIGKSAEADKLINIISDANLNFSSTPTKTIRGVALLDWALIKSTELIFVGADIPADIANNAREVTFTRTLIRRGEIPFNQSGRFDRVIQSVFNELDTEIDRNIMLTWLNNLVSAWSTDSALFIPPAVSDLVSVFVNGSLVYLAPGVPTVDVAEGDSVDMYTAGMYFTSNSWNQVGNDFTHSFSIASIVPGDALPYINTYTNGNGSTAASTITLTVT